MPLIRTQTVDEEISAILTGQRGMIEVDYQLWRSDVSGAKHELIDSVESASVNLSNYRDHTWEIGVRLNEDEAIDPFLDFALAVVRIKGAVTDWHEFPMGLYRFDEPRGSDNQFYTGWDLTGRSIEGMLLDDMAGTGYKVASGTGVLAATRTVLVAQGIPANRINFPSTDVTLTADMIFSPYQDADACYWLRICNALLAAGGFYALFTDAEGYVTTREIEEATEREITARYLANGDPFDEGEEMIGGEIEWEYGSEWWNKVIVYSGDAVDTIPITAVAALHSIAITPPDSVTSIVVDPESNVTYEALGNTYRTRAPESIQNVADYASARKLAKALLRTSAGREITLNFPTNKDPRRGPREDYWIIARRSDGDAIWNGRFRVVGWEFPMDESGEMRHEITRAVKGG